MSEHFSGFSQEEINTVIGGKNPKTVAKEPIRGSHLGIRRVMAPTTAAKKPANMTKKKEDPIHSSKPSTGSKKPATNGTTIKAKSSSLSDREEDDTLDVDLNRSMSRSIEEALFYQPMRSPPNKEATAPISNGHMTQSNQADDSSILKLDIDVTSSTSDSATDSSILQIQTGKSNFETISPDSLNLDSPFKGISLKDFESHRRMIEEQNNQKKELLKKAIELHSRKTAAEARKIEEIKNELSKLDNDLALDVGILRKQIDAACLHFANIEKQYIKIEAQFLKSKIDLHNAAEKKELLTEHLCTVIAHNEDRKAEKLSELMQKVGISAPPEVEYTAPSTPIASENGNNE